MMKPRIVERERDGERGQSGGRGWVVGMLSKNQRQANLTGLMHTHHHHQRFESGDPGTIGTGTIQSQSEVKYQ